VAALGTKSIEKELVSSDAKAARQLGLEWQTAVHLIQSLALIALEVMVVLFPGNFISRRVPRNLHWRKPALFYERLYVAIDGRLTKTRMMMLRALQNLIRGERAGRLKESFPDGRSLRSLYSSFHCN
jgi:hypothetical protein